MGRREKMKGKLDCEDEEDAKQKSVILLSSSDDEEANEDLSLKIVEKARMQATKRKRKKDEFEAFVIDLSSSSCEEIDGVSADQQGKEDGGKAMPVAPEELKKKKRKKKKKNKRIEAQDDRTIDIVKAEEQTDTVKEAGEQPNAVEAVVEAIESVKAEELPDAVEMIDNIVLRKLLRGPRYFDPRNGSLETCYNCGEEGHMAVNCASQKRKKPCFVCGSFDHSVKQCKQGQDCFICKRRGHRAKECPDKHLGSSQGSIICLKCGDLGHDMFSCRNDYASNDLKEIQCYICKAFGHLCCIDFVDTSPREVSCYNCGQSGHIGLGCTKSRAETNGTVSRTLCYRCGEEGHFARVCTNSAKSNRKMSELSTPTQRFSKYSRDSLGFRSVPYDLGKAHKKKTTQYEVVGKKNPRGGWITDDPGDLPRGKAKVNGWRSPATPTKKGHRASDLMAGGHFSNSQSPRRKPMPFPGTPMSHGSATDYQHRFSASRFGNSSSGFKRHYGW